MTAEEIDAAWFRWVKNTQPSREFVEYIFENGDRLLPMYEAWEHSWNGPQILCSFSTYMDQVYEIWLP